LPYPKKGRDHKEVSSETLLGDKKTIEGILQKESYWEKNCLTNDI